eukprot:c20553_g1_i1 orf=161-520(+)
MDDVQSSRDSKSGSAHALSPSTLFSLENIIVDVVGEHASISVTNIPKERLIFSRIVKVLERNNLELLQADVSYEVSFDSFRIQANVRTASEAESGRLQSTLPGLLLAELQPRFPPLGGP